MASLAINVWDFPRRDFADWRDLVDDPQCETYDDYLTLLAAVQADIERHGQTVRRVYMTVDHMRNAIRVGVKIGKRSLAMSQPDARAAVLAMAGNQYDAMPDGWRDP